MTDQAAPPLTATSRIRASDRQISTEIDREAVILHTDSGTYFSLDGVGALVWEQLRQPRRVAELERAVLERYEVEPERCRKDLLALLEELRNNGLIEVAGA